MGNRKESLKKALGINEYPWSSDDENDSPLTTSLSNDGPPPADASPSSPQPSTAQQQQQTRMDREFFWSLLNGRSRVTVPRSSSSIDLQPPRPLPRPLPLPTDMRAAAEDGPNSDIQRILAIRRISNNLSGCRPTRSCSSLFNASRGAPGTGPEHTMQFTDAETLMRARRRAMQRATAMQQTSGYGAGTTRCPSPRRRRTPPVPPVRNRIGTRPLTPSRAARPRPPPAMPCCAGAAGDALAATRAIDVEQSDDDIEMREAPPLSAAEPGANGGQLEGEAEQSCIFGDVLSPPMSRARSSVAAAAGSASGGGGLNSASAIALVGGVVDVDAEAGPARAAAGIPIPGAGDAHDTVNAAPEGTIEQGSNVGERSDQPHGTKRKREEADEPEPNTVQEFNLILLRLLECPVCLEWMEPPMSQCRRGHLVCGRCRARLASCPVCRTAFSSVRNRAMEGVAEMLRYPCRHGCGREVRLRRRAPHEASCTARRYRCVAPACERPPMPLSELAQHLQVKHASLVKTGRKHKFALKVNTELHDTWAVVAHRELFQLRIDVDIRSWGVGVHVAYVGPKCRATAYSYEVTVLGKHHSRKLVYTRATHCDLESSSLNVTRQDCFHLTIDQALNFLRVKNRHCQLDKLLHFYVEITMNTEVQDGNVEDSDLS